MLRRDKRERVITGGSDLVRWLCWLALHDVYDMDRLKYERCLPCASWFK